MLSYAVLYISVIFFQIGEFHWKKNYAEYNDSGFLQNWSEYVNMSSV